MHINSHTGRSPVNAEFGTESPDQESNLSGPSPSKIEKLGVQQNRLAMREAKRFVDHLVIIPARTVSNESATLVLITFQRTLASEPHSVSCI